MNTDALSRIGSVTAEAKGSTKLEENKRQILYDSMTRLWEGTEA